MGFVRTFGTALAALTMAGGAQAACQMGLAAEAPLHLADGDLTVTVTINGHDVQAEIDTINEQSFVEGWALAELGLVQHPINAETVDPQGVRGAFATDIQTLALGQLKFKNTPVFVSGTAGAKHLGTPLRLGSLFVRQLDMELDIKHEALRLFRPKGCTGDEVLYWGGAYSVLPIGDNSDGLHEYLVPVLLNGQTVHAKISSGAAATYVSSAVASRVGAKAVADAARDHKYTNSVTASFDTLVLDQEALKNVQLSVVTMKQIVDPTILGSRLGGHYSLNEMVLGSDFLAAHRVLIANSQNKLYFTYAGGPIFAQPGKSAGE